MSQLGDLQATADREKGLVAATSVAAAVLLTLLKLVVGFMTGSLGIISEAAHSALDLVAAVVTLAAVRMSGRPADESHTYGHGKIENLSALLETVLLLVTAAWIIYEAIQRLFFGHVDVDVTFWAFLVMGVSIVVDITRSRALMKAAKKHKSQALEADAIHFRTDIWSSAVVIGGLAAVVFGRAYGIFWLEQADAVAAILVALIVAWVSVQLGTRAIADLLDAVSPSLREAAEEAASSVHGVEAVDRLRIRLSGPDAFADVSLTVAADVGLERAHAIAELAEQRVQQVVPGADVVVHVTPRVSPDEDELTTVRRLALERGLDVHGLHLYEVPGERALELHVEVPENMTVEQSHDVAEEFEAALRGGLPDLTRVVTHIEPHQRDAETAAASPADDSAVREAIARLDDDLGYACRPHDVRVQRIGGELTATLHCYVERDAPVAEAHALTGRIKAALRARVPGLTRVVVHVEPDGHDEVATDGPAARQASENAG